MTTIEAQGTLLSQAERAVQLAQSNPQQARTLATAVISATSAAKDRPSREARAVAERALGRVDTILEDLTSARQHLITSRRLARAVDSRLLEARARMGLALVLVQEGRSRSALRELDLAADGMYDHDEDLGQLRNQRAIVLWHLGRFDDARYDFDSAAQISRRVGDDNNLLRVYSNRGVIHGQLGMFAAAERDQRRAAELATRLDHCLMLAIVQQNLAWVATQRGDVPTALGCYEQAVETYRPHCEDLGTLLLDRCHVLLAARLPGEAAAAAQQAVAAFRDGHAATAQTEAQLALAEASLLARDLIAARSSAETALRGFLREGRPAWAAQARYALLRATVLDDRAPAASVRRTALRVARTLDASGLHDQALDARVLAARLALDHGKVAAAKRELAEAARARRHGTVERRTRAWHAEALLQLAVGDRVRARAALHSGLRILEEHRAMLGATDLRAAASSYRHDIARLGFAMALQDGRPAEALDWVERSRAGLLRLHPVRPPKDDQLSEALSSLRKTIAEIEEGVRTGNSISALRAKQQVLEKAVRDRSRTLPAGSPHLPSPPPRRSDLTHRLDHRVLVEYVEHDRQVYAITMVDGRVASHRVCSVDDVAELTRVLLLVLNRVARNWGSTSTRENSRMRLWRHVTDLDALLMTPLRRTIADRPLVIAPTGRLRSLPWSLLPSCLGRPVVITPSATAWYEAAELADTPPGADDRVVIAAGPGLPSAKREALLLRDHYPSSITLIDQAAAVAPTLAALDGASVAHIAAHGDFRSDNPLFSSLSLADGPLTVYDLEGLSRAPRRVVLSACDSARDEARPGDEMLGLAAAFLSLGTSVLIASLVSLPDAEASDLMVELHARMCGGDPPAVALAKTQEAARGSELHVTAAAAGLLCFGAG